MDVARVAGVSRGTVSRVLNGGYSVRDSKRSVVLDAVDALGYSVNLAARQLRKGHTGSVAFSLPERWRAGGPVSFQAAISPQRNQASSRAMATADRSSRDNTMDPCAVALAHPRVDQVPVGRP